MASKRFEILYAYSICMQNTELSDAFSFAVVSSSHIRMCILVSAIV